MIELALASYAVRVGTVFHPDGRGVGVQVHRGHCVTWLWLQEAGITRRRTDLAARVSSSADKYSAVAGDAVEASGGSSISTVYRSAADPAASRSVLLHRYVETSHLRYLLSDNA